MLKGQTGKNRLRNFNEETAQEIRRKPMHMLPRSSSPLGFMKERGN